MEKASIKPEEDMPEESPKPEKSEPAPLTQEGVERFTVGTGQFEAQGEYLLGLGFKVGQIQQTRAATEAGASGHEYDRVTAILQGRAGRFDAAEPILRKAVAESATNSARNHSLR